MKITRDAFLYMEPDGSEPEFGQCGTCRMFLRGTCSLHGPDVEVDEDDSCGLYVPGEYDASEREHAQPSVTPDESGLVDRPVRCENCAYYEADDQECELFEMLNEKFPEQFDLDEDVAPEGCCNAQVPDAKMPADEPDDTPPRTRGFARVRERS